MNNYDIVIVGAGPAGLTAAIYSRRASKSVLVLEARAWGGQIINTPDIENYPVVAHISGADFANDLYHQATALGAEVRLEKVVGVEGLGNGKKVRTDLGEYEAGAVILATGSENRKLGAAREQDLIGRGVSYCATCDGNFFRNRDVAVVGGGNTALEDALYLAELANKVYLIHRRDSFRGEEASVERLRQKENVEFVLNATVTALLGEKRLSGIEVTDKLSGVVRTIEVKGLFVAVGRVPANDSFRDLVEMDPAGYVVAGENCHTRIPGVFVAGDARTKEVRQLITAASDGAVAATEAVKYLNAL